VLGLVKARYEDVRRHAWLAVVHTLAFGRLHGGLHGRLRGCSRVVMGSSRHSVENQEKINRGALDAISFGSKRVVKLTLLN